MLVSLIFKTPLIIKSQNEIGLHNYAVITPVENTYITYIKFNNKVNTLQVYDSAQNYRILHKAVQHLSQHNLKVLKYCRTQKLRQGSTVLVAKAVSLKVVHPLKIHQQIKFHGRMLTGASFASTSVV
jgi:hypothetical protein